MTRERLPNRRGSLSFGFEYEGHQYRASVSAFPDGRLAEVFLNTGKLGSHVQAAAEGSAILASLCLQHGVQPETIIHSVKGPVAIALGMAVRS